MEIIPKIEQSASVIKVENLKKEISKLAILRSLSFSIPQSTWASITGPSGSGKTTLLSILAGLDRPTSGQVIVKNQDLAVLNEEELTAFRAHNMGFIFQNFRLIPTLTALENVQIPLEILRIPEPEKLASAMLDRVGLKIRAEHLPSQLSGGEQQRVAVARAFVTRPKILFADEPTGNLDSKNGDVVLSLLRELQKENASTLIVVTHDPEIAALGSLRLHLKDGELQ